MRTPRQDTLPEGNHSVHTIWSFHNKEFALESADMKTLFLESLKRALGKNDLKSKVKLSAFCIMDNHVHKILSYQETSRLLSKLLQIALTRFARIFNDTHQRSGAVGNGRVKTILLQESEASQMRAHMYVEANPIRAKMKKFENLKSFKFNSFRLYAYGIVDKETCELVIPDWYVKLGDSAALRQRRYRSLFKAYIDAEIPIDKAVGKLALFLWELIWVAEKLKKLKLKKINKGSKNRPKITDRYGSITGTVRTRILELNDGIAL